MKVYTGTGDKGKTSLLSGERILKSDHRVEAYGGLDELNAFIGSIAAAWETEEPDREKEIDRIQGWLMDAGAWLATMPDSASLALLKPFTAEPVKQLESAIDIMSDQLGETKQFILPRGHLSATNSHIARTVCRRVERRVIALAHETGQTKALADILVFLNRLSNYLFVLARYLNKQHGMADTIWKGE